MLLFLVTPCRLLIHSDHSTYDTALALKALDLFMADCDKREAKKINSITYSRITDMAAMYRIFCALPMHRPQFSFSYATNAATIPHMHTFAWKIFLRSGELLAGVADKSREPAWYALDDLSQFKMPNGRKDIAWLNRADVAVSDFLLSNHYP